MIQVRHLPTKLSKTARRLANGKNHKRGRHQGGWKKILEARFRGQALLLGIFGTCYDHPNCSLSIPSLKKSFASRPRCCPLSSRPSAEISVSIDDSDIQIQSPHEPDVSFATSKL